MSRWSKDDPAVRRAVSQLQDELRSPEFAAAFFDDEPPYCVTCQHEHSPAKACLCPECGKPLDGRKHEDCR